MGRISVAFFLEQIWSKRSSIDWFVEDVPILNMGCDCFLITYVRFSYTDGTVKWAQREKYQRVYLPDLDESDADYDSDVETFEEYQTRRWVPYLAQRCQTTPVLNAQGDWFVREERRAKYERRAQELYPDTDASLKSIQKCIRWRNNGCYGPKTSHASMQATEAMRKAPMF